nr:GIY-YIG endonuclease [Oedogonium sp. 244]
MSVYNRYFLPKTIYVNVLVERRSILSENDKQSGVYIWIYTMNNKCYIGSSLNLGDFKSGRLTRYFWTSVLKRADKHRSIIFKAILKYGHSSFILGILEYCPPDREIIAARESYYIDYLSPEYNIF